MKRRSFIALAIAAIVAPIANAQEKTAKLPFRTVKKQSSDSTRVLAFFSFTCPVCATYHDPISNWAITLPKGFSFEFVPVQTGDRASAISTVGYYAVKSAAPEKLGVFMSVMYDAIHIKGLDITNPRTWAAVAKKVGVPDLDVEWRKVSSLQTKNALNRVIDYQINATPSLAIAGEYVITPDDTNGDASLFIQLASGMVSKSMVK